VGHAFAGKSIFVPLNPFTFVLAGPFWWLEVSKRFKWVQLTVLQVKLRP
jgi:hypothetical protein